MPSASPGGWNYLCLLCTCVLANKIRGFMRHGWKSYLCHVCTVLQVVVRPGAVCQAVPRRVESSVFAVYVCTSQ
jgi:hypothetical protein